MSEDKKVPAVAVIKEEEMPVWVADLTAEVIALSGIKQKLLNLPIHVRSEELSGGTFQILSLKPFKSSYDKQDHAYFAFCRGHEEIEDGGIFTTVFGGMLLVEVLDGLVKEGLKNPIEVTLKYVRQGKFDGYYIFD